MVWILVSSISIHYHQRQQDVFHLPSLKLTQPLSKSCWKMFFLFPKVDMLVLLSVSTMGISIHQLICTAKLHGFFQYAKQVACSTGWVLTSVTTHSSSSHKGRFCRRAKQDVLTQQKGTGTSNIRPKPASPSPQKKNDNQFVIVSENWSTFSNYKNLQVFARSICRCEHLGCEILEPTYGWWDSEFQWKSPTYVISMKCVPCWL